MFLNRNYKVFDSLIKLTCPLRGIGEKGQATPIAPLQPSTLALFPTWGSSKGAGRRRLARHKISKNGGFLKNKCIIFKEKTYSFENECIEMDNGDW